MRKVTTESEVRILVACLHELDENGVIIPQFHNIHSM